MTEEAYKNIIVRAVTLEDNIVLDIISKMLFESEQAKQELRTKGYGWIGLSLLLTVQQEVPNIRNTDEIPH